MLHSGKITPTIDSLNGCFTSKEQYFSYIYNENLLNNKSMKEMGWTSGLEKEAIMNKVRKLSLVIDHPLTTCKELILLPFLIVRST